MKSFRKTIYKLLHDETFRQEMERDMDNTLARHGLVLSAVEKITVQRMLHIARLDTLQASSNTIPGLPEVDWYFPFSPATPELNANC